MVTEISKQGFCWKLPKLAIRNRLSVGNVAKVPPEARRILLLLSGLLHVGRFVSGGVTVSAVSSEPVSGEFP